MNIDNWPLDRIMRLPDWCFGRRWWVGHTLGIGTGLGSYAISDEQLPDKFVVWGIYVSTLCANCLQALQLTMRLGDHLPADLADAITMERLMKGVAIATTNFELKVEQNGVTWIHAERMIVESAGRRLCFAATGDGTIEYEITAGVLISALPREVPDWLISGSAINLY